MEKTQSIQLVIADDHPIVREGVRRVLEALDKLGVSTRLEIALFAVNCGLPLKPL